MQSIEFKRFPVQLLAVIIAAIALIVIALAATGTLFDDNDGDSGRPSAVVRTSLANPGISTEQMQFMEWNTNLPDAGLGVVGDAPAPVVQLPAVVSAEQMKFLEMNIDLPGTSAPAIVSAERTRFLEMNELPGDDSIDLPFPDPSQPGASPSAY